MRRYQIEVSQKSQDLFLIDKDLFHHIVIVCRQNVGDRFELLCEGKAYFVELKNITKKEATALILEERILKPISKPHIHLCISIPKFATFESIVEKSVELGVCSIKPFFSDHSFVRTSEKITSDRMERWNRIVSSATQQSGRGELMKIHAPQDLRTVLGDFNSKKIGVFAFEGDADSDIQSTLKSVTHDYDEAYLFVGSEGGFSRSEVNLFREKGLAPITLGHQVLRVETACLSLISVIKYHFQLWK